MSAKEAQSDERFKGTGPAVSPPLLLVRSCGLGLGGTGRYGSRLHILGRVAGISSRRTKAEARRPRA